MESNQGPLLRDLERAVFMERGRAVPRASASASASVFWGLASGLGALQRRVRPSAAGTLPELGRFGGT